MTKAERAKRKALMSALSTMPDEAFGWFVLAAANRIWPNGLGGFRQESRDSITAVVKAATAYVESMG